MKGPRLRPVPWWARLYVLWAALAIGLSLAAGGLSPENVTRLMVVGFLGLQVALGSRLSRVLAGLPPGLRFVLFGSLLAAAVEGFHMISRPVFLCLRIMPGTSFAQGLYFYLVDLAFTLPAYLVIFSVIWRFVTRYHYSPWLYLVGFGLAQALGDGGIVYFVGAPAMLLFLPYPMTNYHAVNVLPFLACRPAGEGHGAARYLALPAVIVTYFVCGALIQWIGRSCGFQ